MELIEIKEILKKASVEVDIQGHGKNVALFETDFERVAIELGNKIKPLQEEVERLNKRLEKEQGQRWMDNAESATEYVSHLEEIETLTKRVEELEVKLSSIYKACPIETNNVLINRIKNIANNKGA